MSEPCNLGILGPEQMMFTSFDIEGAVLVPALLGEAPLA
jgi:hypothetical protein